MTSHQYGHCRGWMFRALDEMALMRQRGDYAGFLAARVRLALWRRIAVQTLDATGVFGWEVA